MNYKLRYIFFVIPLICIYFSGNAQLPAEFVNPFIGTTNPGAVVPRRMFSVVPFNVSGNSELNKHDKVAGWWSTPYYWDIIGIINFFPIFDEVKIKLDTNFYPESEFIIRKSGSGYKIKKIRFNGKLNKGYFRNHADVVKGGVLGIIR